VSLRGDLREFIESRRSGSAPVRLVIIGGGTAVVRRLANNAAFDITLLDRQNQFVFQPLLFQVATAALGATKLWLPLPFAKPLKTSPRLLQKRR